MRVLQINITCGIGSTGKIVKGIDKILKDEGNESYVAYGYYDLKEENTFVTKRMSNANGSRIELIKCRLSGYFGFTNKGGTKRLIKWIKGISPDIIHLHNIHGGYVHIEELFKFLKEAEIPVVWTLHDCWGFTGHCAYFGMSGCDKWKTGCFKCPEKTNYPKRYFFDRSKEQYKRKKDAFTSVDNMVLVTPSEWLTSLAKESFLNKYPVMTINNGLDLSVFKPTENNVKKELGIEDKKMVLGVQMSWSERKGFCYIKELAEKLDDSYRVVLIGLTKKQKKGLPKNIIGLGRAKNQEELAKFYTAADVFLNTTLDETFGMVNVEATACGTPVVTFDSGGAKETITTDCGRIVRARDTEAMKKAIEEVLKEDLKDNCIENARKFEAEGNYKKYTELYKRVLRGQL